MKASRRGFLGLMAATPVIGPSLAKEAAKLSSLKVNGVGLASKSFNDDDWVSDESYKTAKKPGYRQQLTSLIKRSDFMKSKGIPEFQRRKWFEDYYCNRFDADLAVNRSMSLVAKLNIQRERDWKKHEHELLNKSYDKYNLLNSIHTRRLRREMIKLGLMKKHDHLSDDYCVKSQMKYDPNFEDDGDNDD